MIANSKNSGPIFQIDHEEERKKDTLTILNSDHPRKIVVAGPGTGKSHLFQEAIKKEKKLGKTKFLALTFIGKLCDELADDLAGLAETRTLHGFARNFVLTNLTDDWEYYPEIFNIIKEDLALNGIDKFEIGDDDYEKRTKYYKAIGDDDVVHYAVQIFKKSPEKIPVYDLVLVDEYQDLNEDEAVLIDLMATKNKMLVVGDDDQALYAFKGAYSKFIKEKFNQSNEYFESHVLKYCSRCTEVIIDTFHNVIDYFKLNVGKDKRITKKYICYIPDKKNDSLLNPKILVMEGVPDGMIAFKIKDELSKILTNQKIKSVLIIGEAQTCGKILSSTARLLSESGFKNVNHKNIKDDIFMLKTYLVQGYKILSKNKNDVLAWRIIIESLDKDVKFKIIKDNFSDSESFVKAIPQSVRDKSIANAKVLNRIFTKPKSDRDSIAKSSIEKLGDDIVIDKKEYSNMLISQLVSNSHQLTRPLRNLDINVCSILGSKGLGADIVFVIGFDQGKLPMKADTKESEIYQFLVAITRAKKRVYLINTKGKTMSKFLKCIDDANYLKI